MQTFILYVINRLTSLIESCVIYNTSWTWFICCYFSIIYILLWYLLMFCKIDIKLKYTFIRYKIDNILFVQF